MTPVMGQNLAASEVRYNNAHAKTRNTVERTFGVLKSRMRCLDASGGTLLYSAPKACKIITACVILNNFCRMNGLVDDDLADRLDEDGDEDGETDAAGPNRLAAQVRRNLIENNF